MPMSVLQDQAALPEPQHLIMQARWLAPARARLLRRVHVARRRCILDLGSGYGSVTPELVRRGGGTVIALERQWNALQALPDRFSGAYRTVGDAVSLPFGEATFDLIFTQLTLLWISPLPKAIQEIERVLQPGGALVALEPDYGGMIEYPPEIACGALWVKGLERAGADPLVGRKLPGLLAAQGFRVRVSLFNTMTPPEPTRFDLLAGLPLTGEERHTLNRIRERAQALSGPWAQIAHLPFVLVTAIKEKRPP